MKILDTKLKNIRSGNYKPSDFIIADAKDADMGGGRRAPGFIREENGKLTETPASYDSYLNKMKEMTKSQMVDVMLMSMTSAERLVDQNIFNNSPVTPAVRLNDTSCIWGLLRHGEYDTHQSRPFATTQLRHAKKKQISMINNTTEKPIIYPRFKSLVSEIRLPSLFAKQVPLYPM